MNCELSSPVLQSVSDKVLKIIPYQVIIDRIVDTVSKMHSALQRLVEEAKKANESIIEASSSSPCSCVLEKKLKVGCMCVLK